MGVRKVINTIFVVLSAKKETPIKLEDIKVEIFDDQYEAFCNMDVIDSYIYKMITVSYEEK